MASGGAPAPATGCSRSGLTDRTSGGTTRPATTNSAAPGPVRWDALPPTLALTCQTSDSPAHVGRAVELKLVRLDGDTLAYDSGGGRLTEFTREADRANPHG